MKSGIISAMLLAAMLACGAGRVQAAPPPDPWGMISAESLGDYCHAGDWLSGAHSGAGENPGPDMEPNHGRHWAGGPSSPPGPPPLQRRLKGEGARQQPVMTGENDPPCPMNLLSLTDAQKKQIAAIILEEREKASPVMKERADVREKLRQSERAATFDEKEVRSMWGNAARLEADMMIYRLKARNRIIAVLTPAQRDRVKKLESGMGRDAARPGKHE